MYIYLIIVYDIQNFIMHVMRMIKVGDNLIIILKYCELFSIYIFQEISKIKSTIDSKSQKWLRK